MPAVEQVRTARLMAKIARAVHHAHLRGVLHRDLKPGNILIDEQGEPHLTDFGLAKILRPGLDDGDARTLTASGDAPGTPSYMSPEQVSGANIGHASDIYGLGAVLYALLTGRPPFQGPTPLDVFQQIIAHSPTQPRALNSSLHPDLETICLKCLEKNPRHRYGAAEALRGRRPPPMFVRLGRVRAMGAHVDEHRRDRVPPLWLPGTPAAPAPESARATSRISPSLTLGAAVSTVRATWSWICRGSRTIPPAADADRWRAAAVVGQPCSSPRPPPTSAG